MVGSYIDKTTRQPENLLGTGLVGLELSVPALLDATRQRAEAQRVARRADELLVTQDVVIYTSRPLVTAADSSGNLALGQRISESLTATVRAITTRPRYLLAKGGVTSSDVATKGFGVSRAVVLGQLLPGVPVWKLGSESRQPGLPYIIFPGNVGGPDALAQVVYALR